MFRGRVASASRFAQRERKVESDPTFRLAAGNAEVELDPAVGGAIATFRWRRQDVLRPTPGAAHTAGDVRGYACYPLIPYSNRIANALLRLPDGTAHALARNFGDHPHAIHGVGWQRTWRIDAHSPSRVLMSLEHRTEGDAKAAWPFAFRAAQAVSLNADDASATLVATLSIENTDTRAFPFGLGWHPFFPRDDLTRLGFEADAVWRTDATLLPTERSAIPDAWRFDPPRTIADARLDNVYTGWRGRAVLAWPQRELEVVLEADRACDHLVVFVPHRRDFLAVEPVTHMTDAFNRAALGDSDTGTRLIAPGQTYSCTMRVVASSIEAR